ncbi:MAG: P-II family nitrogen regulator [bacterium]|nr:P-II family nitrogen regulator [bacterium]
MYMVIAYIRPEKLSDVKKALINKEVFKMSITNALGAGDEEVYHERYRGADVEIDLLKRVRLEIAVNESFIQKTVDAILEGGRTGEDGDGKVFVLPMTQCYQIRTGKKGPHAIG